MSLDRQDSLTSFANNFGSDKGNRQTEHHRYTYMYDLLFYPYIYKEINFLELGLAVGGPELGGPVDRSVVSPSVRMWLSYFKRAHIFGFDISDFSHMRHPRFTFLRGDVGSEADLSALAQLSDGFDVIIDDASHASFHQQLALKTLFSKLRPGGLYIIEDLHWQSPAYEEKLPSVPKTAEFFDKFFMDGVYMPNVLFTEQDVISLSSDVFSYALFNSHGGRSVPKMIVLRKRDASAAY
jgi:SAM-dependent methyltransferase